MSWKFEGTVSPAKIFAVLVLGAGIFLALKLESVELGALTLAGVLALYGVRKLLVKDMIKDQKNGTT